MFFICLFLLTTVAAIVKAKGDPNQKNRGLELISHSNYTKLKALDKRSSDFQKQRRPFVFDRIFGKPSIGDKNDEDDITSTVDDEPVNYVRTKAVFANGPGGVGGGGGGAGDLGPAAFPGFGGGAPFAPVAGIGYSAPALGILDPLFLMITLSFILFLVNSILGLVERGKLGAAGPVRGRSKEHIQPEDVDEMERKFSEALQKYQI